jgi:phage/plasmid-related protein TIGR03299
MPAYFEQGFMVREPAWHGLGVVLDDYPGREKAMELAGHNFKIAELPVYVQGHTQKLAEGFKALVKYMPEDETHGDIMNITRDSYTPIQNDVGWDIVDAIVGEGALYETGITLKGGAVCCVLAWLNEPTQVPGDDSVTLPYCNVSWSHDGSGAVMARATSIRVVCWNTQSAAEMQGKKLGTDFTFRHTKNAMARIEDAKMAMKGIRDNHHEFMELATELANIKITAEQRELFVVNFIPMPEEAMISDRVKNNIEAARSQVRNLFDHESIPEAHNLTGYGLHLAGVEYLDHLRGYQNKSTYFGRQLLKNEPMKAKLTKLIHEVAKA